MLEHQHNNFYSILGIICLKDWSLCWKPECQGEKTKVSVGSQAVHCVPGGKSEERKDLMNILEKGHLWFKNRRCKWRTMAARMPLPSAHRPAWMLPYRKLANAWIILVWRNLYAERNLDWPEDKEDSDAHDNTKPCHSKGEVHPAWWSGLRHSASSISATFEYICRNLILNLNHDSRACVWCFEQDD